MDKHILWGDKINVKPIQDLASNHRNNLTMQEKVCCCILPFPHNMQTHGSPRSKTWQNARFDRVGIRSRSNFQENATTL